MSSAIWCLMPTKNGERAASGGPKETGTKQVRLFTDVAEMIADLADLLDVSTAQVCDPILRAEIEEQWHQHRASIEEMKELQQKQDAIRLATQSKPKPRRKA